MVFLSGIGGKEPSCQCRRRIRHGFDPWVGKIPWRLAWQPTPVFFPGESYGQSCKESDMTEVIVCMHALETHIPWYFDWGRFRDVSVHQSGEGDFQLPLLFWLVLNHHANVKMWTIMEKWSNVQGHCLQQKQTSHDVQARNGIWELAVFHPLTYTAIIRWGLSHKIGQKLRLWVIVTIWMLTLCQVLC